MKTKRDPRLAEMHGVYEQFGKPLEADHWGRYVAITSDGRTLLGDTLYDVSEQATEAFGYGSFLFKVGERAVGKIR
jgi:hypothetical protein